MHSFKPPFDHYCTSSVKFHCCEYLTFAVNSTKVSRPNKQEYMSDEEYEVQYYYEEEEQPAVRGETGRERFQAKFRKQKRRNARLRLCLHLFNESYCNRLTKGVQRKNAIKMDTATAQNSSTVFVSGDGLVYDSQYYYEETEDEMVRRLSVRECRKKECERRYSKRYCRNRFSRRKIDYSTCFFNVETLQKLKECLRENKNDTLMCSDRAIAFELEEIEKSKIECLKKYNEEYCAEQARKKKQKADPALMEKENPNPGGQQEGKF